ncbi:MAG: NAD(P)H-hydrate dehydratase [Meiothermus sp.]|nr:NAD(P)H-hydrate dehydratase [Meiothermus sp.]
MHLYTPQDMREADAKAALLGYPSLLLMDTAGRIAARTLVRAWPERKAVVLCGKGNNGGDGLVAARWLHVWGNEVEVYAAEGQSGDALLARQALLAHGLEIRPLEQFRPERHTAILDALVGTGLRGQLEGFYAELVGLINGSGLPILSVDVPSGLPYSPHVRAGRTVALAGLKREHVFYPWRQSCGQIYLNAIGMPPAALGRPDLPEILTPAAMRGLLPAREGKAHKGSVGRVLVAGGFRSYTGAPSLSALGAYRIGLGLVTVAYPADCEVQPPMEAVRLPLFDWNLANLQTAKADAVAVGMGAGDGGTQAALAALELVLPAVLDADALQPRVLSAYSQAGIPTVVTPHPGEAGRLLGVPPSEIANRPLEYAAELAGKYPNLVVVLKGGPTVIAHKPSIQAPLLAVNSTGNPEMATGGMGDVLSGVIAALLSKGLSAWDAARLGVYLHGLAGDLARKPGLMAREVAEALPGAMERLGKGAVRAYWEAEGDG